MRCRQGREIVGARPPIPEQVAAGRRARQTKWIGAAVKDRPSRAGLPPASPSPAPPPASISGRHDAPLSAQHRIASGGNAHAGHASFFFLPLPHSVRLYPSSGFKRHSWIGCGGSRHGTPSSPPQWNTATLQMRSYPRPCTSGGRGGRREDRLQLGARPSSPPNDEFTIARTQEKSRSTWPTLM